MGSSSGDTERLSYFSVEQRHRPEVQARTWLVLVEHLEGGLGEPFLICWTLNHKQTEVTSTEVSEGGGGR